MGNRIHKAAGYGLKDIDWDNDPRIDQEALGGLDEKLPGFLKFVQNKDHVKMLVKNLQLGDIAGYPFDWALDDLKHADTIARTLDKSIIVEDNFLLFLPPELRGRHYRFDDELDYIEDSLNNNGKGIGTTVVNLIDNGVSGLLPYGSAYIIKPWIKSKYPQIGLNAISHDEMKHWLSISSNDIIDHLKQDWVPIIPMTVRLLAAYLGIFKDPKTIFDLRPLLCTWWC